MLSGLFDSNDKQVKKLASQVEKINRLAEEFSSFSSEQVKSRTSELKKAQSLDDILPEAFALVKIATEKTQAKVLHDVQLVAGIALHQGKIAEMRTGEGKTNVAVLPIYLNALTGQGVHLVTPNDYLSRHGAGWMGPIYDYLGVSVAVIIHEQAFIYDVAFNNESFLDEYSRHFRPVSRQEAYRADITYGTNNEFGFDFLRDNMVWDPGQKVQRGHHYAIVDEVDSILIDEARTPLIISAPAADSTSRYYDFAKIAAALISGTDFRIEEKEKSAHLTELGVVKVEKLLGINNIYETDFEAVHHIENAVRAHAVYKRDRDYVVKDGEVIIVDEFTGRLMPGRRFSEGMHQALEAKENVTIQKESKTLATISFQNYFRLYKKLAGMTGTALTEAEEFSQIYNLDVISIPTHRSMVRVDSSDIVYKTVAGKMRAVVDDVTLRHARGQPLLIGTVSVDTSELLSSLLKRRGIPHEVLNAKNHEREALIIAQSGRKNAVTVATNMAGRGVDIILGGDPGGRDVAEWEKEHNDVVSVGGLAVIGTERHESRRIDNQLRGRSGRQGDPGFSRFYVSLQDDLMRRFGGDMVASIMERFGLDENTPLEAGMVSRSIESAQKKVEGHNFDIRKHLVEYDDVMNKQREVVYSLRDKLLAGDYLWLLEKIGLPDKVEQYGQAWPNVVKQVALQIIDTLWIDHLTYMDDLREGIGLRSYGQQDPLVAYKREGRLAFERLMQHIYDEIAARLDVLEKEAATHQQAVAVNISKPKEMEHARFVHQESDLGVRDEIREMAAAPVVSGPHVGRNDPCPCGSGKKFKTCHGR